MKPKNLFFIRCLWNVCWDHNYSRCIWIQSPVCYFSVQKTLFSPNITKFDSMIKFLYAILFIVASTFSSTTPSWSQNWKTLSTPTTSAKQSAKGVFRMKLAWEKVQGELLHYPLCWHYCWHQILKLYCDHFPRLILKSLIDGMIMDSSLLFNFH